MKYSLFFLLIILAFVRCKDDEQVKPVTEAVYEDWKVLPDSTIRYGYRNIVATEVVGNQLYVQAKNAHYMLDSNLILDENNYNIEQRTAIKYPYDLAYSIKHNTNYVLFPEFDDMLIIRDAKQINLSQIEGHIYLPSLVNDYANGDGQNYCWSAITADNRFDVATLSYDGDTAIYTVIEFQINHSPEAFQKIDIKETGRMVVTKELDKLRYASTRNSIKCWRIEGIRYVWISGICKLYRFKGNSLIDVNRFNIGNILKHDRQIVAGSKFVYYFADSLMRDNGLILSGSNRNSWDYVGYGDDLAQFPIKSLGGELVIYGGSVISTIDLETGDIDKVDLTGLDASIHSIEKIGSKVVVGTDAGVYYKSWDSFLNK